MTFGQCLAILQEQQKQSAEPRPRSREYTERAAECLLKTWPGLPFIMVVAPPANGRLFFSAAHSGVDVLVWTGIVALLSGSNPSAEMGSAHRPV